jgi:hypothetical protein
MNLTGTKLKLLMITTMVCMTLLAACQPATPLPSLNVLTDTEFTLAPDQTATITDAGLTIRLIGVSGDERCPSQIECAMSGPVSISFSLQAGDGETANLVLRTFTDNNGLAPEMQFEGVESRSVYRGYVVQLISVLPYPVNLTNTIRDSEYRVTLTVGRE